VTILLFAFGNADPCVVWLCRATPRLAVAVKMDTSSTISWSVIVYQLFVLLFTRSFIS